MGTPARSSWPGRPRRRPQPPGNRLEENPPLTTVAAHEGASPAAAGGAPDIPPTKLVALCARSAKKSRRRHFSSKSLARPRRRCPRGPAGGAAGGPVESGYRRGRGRGRPASSCPRSRLPCRNPLPRGINSRRRPCHGRVARERRLSRRAQRELRGCRRRARAGPSLQVQWAGWPIVRSPKVGSAWSRRAAPTPFGLSPAEPMPSRSWLRPVFGCHS